MRFPTDQESVFDGWKNDATDRSNVSSSAMPLEGVDTSPTCSVEMTNFPIIRPSSGAQWWPRNPGSDGHPRAVDSSPHTGSLIKLCTRAYSCGSTLCAKAVASKVDDDPEPLPAGVGDAEESGDRVPSPRQKVGKVVPGCNPECFNRRRTIDSQVTSHDANPVTRRHTLIHSVSVSAPCGRSSTRA